MGTNPYKTYIARFPRKFRPELQQKLKYKMFLEEKNASLILPPLAWYSFLTPSDPSSEKILKKSESKIWQLKKKMLASFKQPEKIISEDSPKFTGTCITTMLLEMLFDLETSKVLLTKDRYIIWVDIAEKYGLWPLRYYLEDAIFKNFDPVNYKLFRTVVEKKMREDANLISDTRLILKDAFAHARIKGIAIFNRRKNVYGVYSKMHKKRKNINDIWDIHGFRILARTERDCYKIVETLHRLWPSYENRFKDYIREPKPNGYRSIHTVVICLRKTPIEFQVRSFDMDIVAQSGPANHAEYKKYT